MGPQDPAEVTRDLARDLTGLSGELAALKHRLEDAHAAVEAALIEARRRVRINEGR